MRFVVVVVWYSRFQLEKMSFDIFGVSNIHNTYIQYTHAICFSSLSEKKSVFFFSPHMVGMSGCCFD